MSYSHSACYRCETHVLEERGSLAGWFPDYLYEHTSARVHPRLKLWYSEKLCCFAALCDTCYDWYRYGYLLEKIKAGLMDE